jgi:hypothetical protein
MEYRTTSRAGDEAICLAIMIGLDMSPILACDGAPERMKQLFITLGEVPRGIVWSDGEKVALKGARWAPVSLLATKHPSFMLSTQIGKAMITAVYQAQYAFPTNDGLMMRCPGILLCLSPSRADYRNAAELQFHSPAFMNEQGWMSTIRPATIPQWEPPRAANERRDKLYNLIGDLPRPAILLRPPASGDMFWDVAALVSIEKEEDDVLHAAFQCKIGLAKSNDMVLDAVQSSYARPLEDLFESLGMGPWDFILSNQRRPKFKRNLLHLTRNGVFRDIQS